MSESINGFALVRPFTNAGGGQSRWTFARRNGTEYFIKEFLSPTYPVPDAPGSTEIKRRKLERCQAFEAHHNEMTNALAELSLSGGNLVVTRRFFRHGAKYYRVTDKVDVSSLPPAGIAALARDRQVAIALAVTHSVGVLHRRGIVHGDLKPPNVLINDRPPKGYSTKLIDFDNAFFDGRPPPAEDLVGDPAYYSPELLSYVNGDGPGGRVGLASDVFALGVLFLSYFGADVLRAGEGGRALYPAEEVLSGGRINTGLADIWPEADALVSRMTDIDPGDRPAAATVHSTLKKLFADPDHPGESPPSGGVSRIRGRSKDKGPGPTPPQGSSAEVPTEPVSGPRKSRIRGKVVERSREGEPARLSSRPRPTLP